MKVVVGIDGSPDAVAAIAVGAELFPGALAWIAHVWMPPFTVHPPPALRREARTVEGFIDMLEQQGLARAEQIVGEGRRRAEAAGWTVEPVARRGFAGPGLELARLAEEREADALIVGARGLSGVRAVLGSVSDAVAHYSPVPVLVVPRSREDDAAGTGGPVLVASDGSPGAALAQTAALQLWPSREHAVATVMSPATAELVQGDGSSRVVLAPKGVPETARSVADALAEHAAAIGAAVIVVGSRGRSVHREILLGSVAMATLHHAHRPVLAVPPPMRLAGTSDLGS